VTGWRQIGPIDSIALRAMAAESTLSDEVREELHAAGAPAGGIDKVPNKPFGQVVKYGAGNLPRITLPVDGTLKLVDVRNHAIQLGDRAPQQESLDAHNIPEKIVRFTLF
jgi:hypothetical protein